MKPTFKYLIIERRPTGQWYGDTLYPSWDAAFAARTRRSDRAVFGPFAVPMPFASPMGFTEESVDYWTFQAALIEMVEGIMQTVEGQAQVGKAGS